MTFEKRGQIRVQVGCFLTNFWVMKWGIGKKKEVKRVGSWTFFFVFPFFLLLLMFLKWKYWYINYQSIICNMQISIMFVYGSFSKMWFWYSSNKNETKLRFCSKLITLKKQKKNFIQLFTAYLQRFKERVIFVFQIRFFFEKLATDSSILMDCLLQLFKALELELRSVETTDDDFEFFIIEIIVELVQDVNLNGHMIVSISWIVANIDDWGIDNATKLRPTEINAALWLFIFVYQGLVGEIGGWHLEHLRASSVTMNDSALDEKGCYFPKVSNETRHSSLNQSDGGFEDQSSAFRSLFFEKVANEWKAKTQPSFGGRLLPEFRLTLKNGENRVYLFFFSVFFWSFFNF